MQKIADAACSINTLEHSTVMQIAEGRPCAEMEIELYKYSMQQNNRAIQCDT